MLSIQRLCFCLLVLTSCLSAEGKFCCDNQPACWQGLYLSGQLGGGWNRSHAKFNNANYFNTLGPLVLGSDFHFKSTGFVGGGALGYNYQRGCFVLGLEGGALSVNLNKKRKSPYFPASDTYYHNLQWLANAKVRAGYAHKRLLAFITGGWAGGNVSLKLKDSPSDIVASSTKWANGWTVGAGVDYRISRCFSLGLAYDYIRLQYNTKTISCSTCGAGVGFGAPKVSNHLRTQMLTVRLNYNL